MQRERKMKLCHATALLLSAWVLMTPPPVKDPPVVDVTAPYSQWRQWNIPWWCLSIGRKAVASEIRESCAVELSSCY